MRQSTLDLLDAELRRDYNKYKNFSYKDRLKIFSHQNVRIDPRWSNEKYKEIKKYNFNWSKPVKYSDHPDFKKIIKSDAIGVYLIIVKPDYQIENMPQQLMYVGISGEGGSARPLKDRLTDYLYFNKIKIRDGLHTMLQLYYDEVYIIYSEFTKSWQELEDLETSFHEYFNPLYSKRDFEPPTKSAQKGWNMR